MNVHSDQTFPLKIFVFSNIPGFRENIIFFVSTASTQLVFITEILFMDLFVVSQFYLYFMFNKLNYFECQGGYKMFVFSSIHFGDMHKTLKAEETLTPFIKRLKILTLFDEHIAIYQARLSNKATTDIKTSIPNLYFKQSYTRSKHRICFIQFQRKIV